MLAMQVADVTFPTNQSAIVLLGEDTQQVRLRFNTTYAGGGAILAALQQTPAIRPPIQVMFLEVLQRFNIRVCRATIDELREGLLYAHLHVQSSDGKSVTVDALPSDAASMALRAGVPLEVSEQVVAEMGCRRGQMIDVGGRQLSAHVKGSGSPVVILESPFGTGHEIWRTVLESVAQFTTVCSYDRAGLGWSDSAPEPRALQDSVKDFHALLQGLRLPAPYVLVGHSIGGPLAIMYACTHSAEVVGLVLIDSSHHDQDARFLAALPAESAHEPPSVHALRKDLLNPAALSLEWNAASVCWEQARACSGLGALPLAVITAAKRGNPTNLPEDVLAAQERVWLELQRDLARLSPRSTQRFAELSGHNVPRDQPEIVIDTIREMVDSIRQA